MGTAVVGPMSGPSPPLALRTPLHPSCIGAKSGVSQNPPVKERSTVQQIHRFLSLISPSQKEVV